MSSAPVVDSAAWETARSAAAPIPTSPGIAVDMDAPSTRYAKALDGGYNAYVVLGEAAGKRDVTIVGSIATNLELFLEFEPAASSWWELARFARLSLHGNVARQKLRRNRLALRPANRSFLE